MKTHFFSTLVGCTLWAAAVQAQLPLLQTEGTYFVKATTKEKIVLKGIDISNNCWGFYEWPISDSLEKAGMTALIRPREMKPFVFTSDDVERIAQLDGNMVRYCFNDGLFHADNPKRQTNIALLRSHVAQLTAKGIYSVVTMQMNPGLDGQNDFVERLKPAKQRLQSPFESDSVFRLWRDTWQFVASNLADLDGVAGYELIVEPRRPALADANEQKLVRLYVEVIDSIRVVDKRHIVMVPEFNSREANPGQQYWHPTQHKMVTDRGEQGIIWEREWMALPNSIANLVYVAHIYHPFEFTTDKSATDFDVAQLQQIVQTTADWVYAQGKPVYVSEYGVTYFHTMRGRDAKRTEWLKTIHDAFDAYHMSTSAWQYKDLITPWVNMEGTFGIWQHYYDPSTVKSVTNGQVEYSDEAAEKAAIASKIDEVLRQYFIEDESLKSISLVGNQTLVDELNRYFRTQPLGLLASSKSAVSHSVFVQKEYLYIKGLPTSSGTMPVALFTLDGKLVQDTVLPIQEGQVQLLLDKSGKPKDKVWIVRYGAKGEWSAKVVVR